MSKALGIQQLLLHRLRQKEKLKKTPRVVVAKPVEIPLSLIDLPDEVIWAIFMMNPFVVYSLAWTCVRFRDMFWMGYPKNRNVWDSRTPDNPNLQKLFFDAFELQCCWEMKILDIAYFYADVMRHCPYFSLRFGRSLGYLWHDVSLYHRNSILSSNNPSQLNLLTEIHKSRLNFTLSSEDLKYMIDNLKEPRFFGRLTGHRLWETLNLWTVKSLSNYAYKTGKSQIRDFLYRRIMHRKKCIKS